MEANQVKLKLRAHHLDYLIRFCRDNFEYPKDYCWSFYGRDMAFYLADVHESARKNPNSFEITLVEGPDDFCGHGCWLLPKCSSGKPFTYAMEVIDNWKDDAEIIQRENWELGKTCNLGELISRYKGEK
jgi:hypothetical protein